MNSKEHSWSLAKRLLLATVAMVVLAVGVAGFRMLQSDRFEHQSLVPITDDISLGVAAVLTSDNKSFSIPTWRTKIYDGLPKWGQKAWIQWRSELPRAAEWKYYGNPGRAELAMYYSVPKKWVRDQNVIERELGKPKGSDLLSLVAQYDNGWHSDWSDFHKLAFDIYTDVPGLIPVYHSPGFSVPVHQEFFDVLVFKAEDKDKATSDSLIGSYRLKNPSYDKVEPLKGAQRLPIAVTKGDVTVTLRGFVSKVQQERAWQNFDKWKNRTDAVTGEDFVRAAGTFSDSYGGMTAFTVEEAGTSISQWIVDKAKISYGKKLHPFPTYPSYVERDNLYVDYHQDDPGMLQQPVKFTVSLKRGRRYPADEIQKVEIPVPAAGTSDHEGSKVKFWTGPGTVGVVYKRKVNIDWHPVGTNGAVTLVYGGGAKSAEVKRVELVGEGDVNLDLTDAGGGIVITSGHRFVDFFPEANRLMLVDAKKMLEKDTTLSVTLVSPRSFPHEFEFIAEPIEATGKKQAGGFWGKLFGM